MLWSGVVVWVDRGMDVVVGVVVWVDRGMDVVVRGGGMGR